MINPYNDYPDINNGSTNITGSTRPMTSSKDYPDGTIEPRDELTSDELNRDFNSKDELDEILENICMHSLQTENGKITILYEGLSPQKAKAALTTYIAREIEAVIGEDGTMGVEESRNRCGFTQHQNELRTEQRKRAIERGYKIGEK